MRTVWKKSGQLGKTNWEAAAPVRDLGRFAITCKRPDLPPGEYAINILDESGPFVQKEKLLILPF